MRGERAAPFSKSVVILLVACAAALFALSVLLQGYGENGESPRSADPGIWPGTYAISAIGHRGLYDLLQATGRPAVRSIGNTRFLLGDGGTLVIAEPRPTYAGDGDAVRRGARRVLLVLPKWVGAPDRRHAGWISEAFPVPPHIAEETLRSVLGERGTVRRGEWPGTWRVNELGPEPCGAGAVQLVQSELLRPVVGDESGMLVGEFEDEHGLVWVLSDPDVMSNHGIVQGDNARFMLALLDRLRMWENGDAAAPLVFDETVHGYHRASGSPYDLLFRFPFSVVTILTGCAALLFVAAGSKRFGVPRVAAPPLDFGKSGLIRNSAHLLDYTGHHAVVLGRYVRMTVHAAARALHMPSSLGEAELVSRLDQVGRARGVTSSCTEILQRANRLMTQGNFALAEMFEVAWDIYRWKGELLHDAGTSRRHSS